MSNDARRSASRVATVVAVPLALLAGFVAFQALKPKAQATGPVTMMARTLDGRQADVCRALVASMPQAVRDRHRRPVTAGNDQNAAFGDPAITLECGGELPSYPATQFVYSLSGVCYLEPDPAKTRWITVDREVPVIINVPKGYDSPAQWVTAFSDAITATVPTAHVPAGCKG